MTHKIKSSNDVAEYLNHEKIECLECGKRYQFLPVHLSRMHQMTAVEYRQLHDLPAGTPLAGLEYRRMQRDKMRRMQREGRANYDHLPAASAKARDAGRGQRTEWNLKEQAERAKKIPHEQLPPGAKRANGRDADRAREYQREYRKKMKNRLN